MCPFVTIGTQTVPTYLICAIIGLMASMLIGMWLLSERGVLRGSFSSLLVSIPAILVGGRLFGTLSILLGQLACGNTADLSVALSRGGSVYWGGLLCYLLTVVVICRIRRVPVRPVMDVASVCISLFHAVARIGCFEAGCCYGIESKMFGLLYRTALDETLVSRIPVQLIEAVLELALFSVLLIKYRRRTIDESCRFSSALSTVQSPDAQRDEKKAPPPLIVHYLTVYACGRFALEFLRGDMVRGVFFGISFSQYISAFVVLTIGIAWVFSSRCALAYQPRCCSLHLRGCLSRRAP